MMRGPTPDDDAVYRQLHAAIVDQRLPAGSRLTETALAELLSASRRHVDKALWRLVQEKLVRMRRNAGAWVAAPSLQEAREIYGLRLVVEEAAARQACTAWRPEGLRTLKANLAAEEAAQRRGDLREAVRLSGEFHVLLARVAGNTELARVVEQLVARTSLVTQLHANPDGLGCWHSQHHGLVEAIAQRQADRAAALMRAHLLELEEALRVRPPASRHHELERALKRPLPPPA
ncbi:GntR family transcriptional regulator [Pseudorhodoferax sp.]|uniref:GntR family transcriptional regulator n=1 Tax=Pseudorhodoferax sp. TaxID=1993553 RepID=UPI0039E2B717